MRRLAAWSYRHRRFVLFAWVAALVVSNVLARSVGTAYSNDFRLPNTESTRALDLLKSVAPAESGDIEHVVIATSGGAKVTDPAVQARVAPMLAKLSTLAHVTGVVSPYGPQGAAQISRDGRVAFADVTYDKFGGNLPQSTGKHLVDTATAASGGNVQIAVSGQLAGMANRRPVGGTGIGIIAAGIVLFLVFGSLFAMLLPLMSALAALGTATAVIGLLTHVLKMPDFSSELVLLIGLGVGVDYALFIVSRHRQGLLAGVDVETSVITAIDTSGRTVLFAGIIVCVALFGMFALGISFLYGLAIAASIGVLFTMLAALTLLPALLGFLGPKVLSRKQRRGIVPGAARRRGFWTRWAEIVERRPVLAGASALVLVLALAAPFLKLRLGSSDQGNDPKGTTTRTAYDLLAKGFGPGFNGPLQITTLLHGPQDQAALGRVVRAVQTERGVVAVSKPAVLPGKDGTSVAVFTAYPSTAPQDAATTDLVTRLRTLALPAATRGSDLTVYVGGITAIFIDFAHILSAKLPLFVGLVVLLSFLLLVLVFRSLVVPLKAAVMNLVSIAAAFGILTAVFQWGWTGSLYGVNRPGPIESFLPVMLFAILFGLSMDYEVFLVMRIHEEWLRTGDNREAVKRGLAATGRTITAAAAIMVVVFASFILGGERIIKEFGLGLSAAILIDAIVIRSALVPSLMFLFGKANWWFPRWLDRALPRIHVEPEDLDEIEEPSLSPEVV